MHAYLDLTIREFELAESGFETEKKSIKHYTQKAWKSITEHVSFDEDGIFKDPNWPHMWS